MPTARLGPRASVLLSGWHGRAGLNGVFQNDTFYRRPFWCCLTSGHVSVSQFAGQTGFKCKQTGRLNDPWTNQMGGQVADLKRRIPILKRLIADCDRLAADLDQEVRNEEDLVRIHDPRTFRLFDLREGGDFKTR